MPKKRVYKLPVPPPEQSAEQPKKRWRLRRTKVRSIHSGQVLFNGTYFDMPDSYLTRTRGQIMREGLRDIWNDLKEKLSEFFSDLFRQDCALLPCLLFDSRFYRMDIETIGAF